MLGIFIKSGERRIKYQKSVLKTVAYGDIKVRVKIPSETRNVEYKDLMVVSMST